MLVNSVFTPVRYLRTVVCQEKTTKKITQGSERNRISIHVRDV